MDALVYPHHYGVTVGSVESAALVFGHVCIGQPWRSECAHMTAYFTAFRTVRALRMHAKMPRNSLEPKARSPQAEVVEARLWEDGKRYAQISGCSSLGFRVQGLRFRVRILLGGSGGLSKWLNNPCNPYSNPNYPQLLTHLLSPPDPPSIARQSGHLSQRDLCNLCWRPTSSLCRPRSPGVPRGSSPLLRNPHRV